MAETQSRQSPLVVRRQLTRQLERLRKERGFTQTTAAKAFGWSARKQQLLEAGDQPTSASDLDTMLPVLEVPGDEQDEWYELAGAAAAKGWWDEYDDADLPRSAKLFAGYEAGARRIRSFTNTLVPPLLHMPNYVRAAFRAGATTAPLERISQLTEARLRRQQIISGPDPLDFHAVVDEAFLYRQAGGPDTMTEQLNHLVNVLTEHPNVVLQIVANDAGLYPAQAGIFNILDFDLPDDPGLVHVEPVLVGSIYVEERSQIYVYSQVFEHLQEIAMSPEDSLELLCQVASNPKGHSHV